MNYTYRQSKQEELPVIIDFINYVFSHDHCPHDFMKLVPKVYGNNPKEHAVHFIAVNDNNQIVGVVGLLPMNYHINNKVLKCGYIGSVSVHPYYRSEGHMKKLMALADEYLKTEEYDLGILDGMRQRYEYYGYRKSGISVHYEVASDNVKHALKNVDINDFNITEITDAEDTMLDNIWNAFVCQPVFMGRSRDTLLYTLKNFENRIFAVTYKGEYTGYFTVTNNNSISEINMNKKEDYYKSIKLWKQYCDFSEITIIAQPHQTDLLNVLDSFSEDRIIKNGASFKIFNQDNTYLAIDEYKDFLPDGMAELFSIPLPVAVADSF